MIPEIIVSVIIASFILEFFDSSVGMGFGTLTPVLILLGFPPLQAIPAVLFCSAVLSLTAGVLHHSMKNINFFEKENLKILGIFLGFGVVAIIIGAFVAVNIPEYFLDIYIGLLTLAIGIIVIRKFRIRRKVSLKRIVGFASVASLNKGLTGGGFGPVLSGGQIISGVKSKRAVGITALTEGTLSIVGVVSYVLLKPSHSLNWSLIVSLLIGGLLSVPLAVYFVKIVHPKKIRITMGILSIILGAGLLLKILVF